MQISGYFWPNNGKWSQCMQIKGTEKVIDLDSHQLHSRGRITGEGWGRVCHRTYVSTDLLIEQNCVVIVSLYSTVIYYV